MLCYEPVKVIEKRSPTYQTYKQSAEDSTNDYTVQKYHKLNLLA